MLGKKIFIIGVFAAVLAVLGAGCGEDSDSIVDPVDPVGEPTIVGFGDDQALTSIERMSGCYAVRYQFIEDGGDKDFFFEDNIEYMDVQPMGDGLLVRNFLVLPDQTSFLHFTQEWTPLGDGVWNMVVSDGEGNLRYESKGPWRFNQWEGDNAPAVKPNRDSERADYDVLERRNSFQFTDGTIIQAEINVKSLEDGTPVSSELGWIVYTVRPTTDPCAPAIAIANPDS